MKTANKRIFWHVTAFLIIGSIIQYALFHAANLLKFDSPGVVLGYFTYYYDRIWEFLAPALSALTMILTYTYYGCKTSLVNGVVYAAARAVYYIPLGYIMWIGYGYDSLESLIGGIVTALASCAIAYVESILCSAIALIPASIASKRDGKALPLLLRSELPQHDALDVFLAGTAATAIISLLQFLKILISEIKDTVEFFAGNSSYTTEEVLYVVFKYFFAIVLLAAFHFLLSFIKRKMVDTFTSDAEDQPKETKEI